MSYLHIPNLYKDASILLLREVFAMEKIHGSSAHVSWNSGKVGFFAGGVDHQRFCRVFNEAALTAAFTTLSLSEPTIVYGEVYGASTQKMSATYGNELRFVAFDVQIGSMWLNLPVAVDVVGALKLEFVHYEKTSTDLAALDKLRDAPSVQAQRNGCGTHPREGIVLRPLIELTKNNGERLIAKHKNTSFSERATPQKVLTTEQVKVLAGADAIAAEWVTPARLGNVLSHFPPPLSMQTTAKVLSAMLEDVSREAKGEIVESAEARKAISKRTAELFRVWLSRGAGAEDRA